MGAPAQGEGRGALADERDLAHDAVHRPAQRQVGLTAPRAASRAPAEHLDSP
jgi:hypothetical protein